jgi:hypothetical protein
LLVLILCTGDGRDVPPKTGALTANYTALQPRIYYTSLAANIKIANSIFIIIIIVSANAVCVYMYYTLKVYMFQFWASSGIAHVT